MAKSTLYEHRGRDSPASEMRRDASLDEKNFTQAAVRRSFFPEKFSLVEELNKGNRQCDSYNKKWAVFRMKHLDLTLSENIFGS